MVLALAATVASAAALGSRLLYLGMKGSDVTTLQKDLTDVGIKTKATGTFNKTTRSHVEKFQREHDLEVDGVVGPQTVSELKAVLKADRPASKASTGTGGTTTATSSSGSSCSTTGTTGTTDSGSGGTADGGVGIGSPAAACPVVKLSLNSKGLVEIPTDVPTVIAKALRAANKIAHRPYVYGGGHNGWGPQPGYDCSGSTSYVLHAAGLMDKSNGVSPDLPWDSTQFEQYGAKGAGRWITLFTNAGHVYMKISNLFFDTAAQSGENGQDRWTAIRISTASGFYVRHPKGW